MAPDEESADETRFEGGPTPLDSLPPSAFDAARHAGGGPTRSPPRTQAGKSGRFAEPPPHERPRFEPPLSPARPVDPRPPTWFDAPVREPPRAMLAALGASLAAALVQAILGLPTMLLLPGCAPAQLVFAVLVAVTCWRGRSYGRPLAVASMVLWVLAAALAFRGHSNMVSVLAHEAAEVGRLGSRARIAIILRAVLEAFVVWTLFRSDVSKYFAHRAAVDRLGGRKWE